MKHRSSVILIIIVAVLAVAPHAAQRLDDFGSSLVGRAESAVWNAFLSLHARHPRLPQVRRTDAPAREVETAANVAPNRETKGRERVESRAAQSGRTSARERKGSADATSFEAPARPDVLVAGLPQGFAFNSFVPLQLDLRRVEAGENVAVLKALKTKEVALAPAARFISADALLGREEARRLSRIVERHVRTKDPREALQRRRAGEVGPRFEVEEEKSPAPERGAKAKAQARVACPAPMPEIPPASPATYVDAGMQGFDIDN